MPTGQNLLIVFTLNSCKIALPVSRLVEIAEGLEITYKPTEGFIMGSVELRGNIYPLIDLKARLGLVKPEIEKNEIFLIVDNLSKIYALPVDLVVGISENAEFLSVPVDVFKEPDVISSFIMQDKDVVSVLDIKEVTRDIL